MKILSHRGLWYKNEEKNTAKAFEESFSLGFGTETDIRDYKGKLVIAHDIANGSEISLDEMLEIYCQYDKSLVLALNIKADGLQNELEKSLKKYDIKNYFLFDMSVPEAVKYSKGDFKIFTRESEYETNPSLYEESEGVWIDCFRGDWIDENVIKKHLNKSKVACVVSPDLHKREYLKTWEKYKNLTKENDFLLCTDYPKQAKEFFKI